MFRDDIGQFEAPPGGVKDVGPDQSIVPQAGGCHPRLGEGDLHRFQIVAVFKDVLVIEERR